MKDSHPKSIACIGLSETTTAFIMGHLLPEFSIHSFRTGIEFYNTGVANKHRFSAILSESDLVKSMGLPLKAALNKNGYADIPFCLIVDSFKSSLSKTAMEHGITEIFLKPLQVLTW